MRVSALGGALDVAVQVATRMERDGIGVSAEPKQGPEMGNPWGTHGEPMGNATSTKCAVATNDPDICIKRTPHSLGDAAHVT